MNALRIAFGLVLGGVVGVIALFALGFAGFLIYLVLDITWAMVSAILAS